MEQIIEKHFNHENGSGLRSSAQHYSESGKPSGSMLIAIRNSLKEYAIVFADYVTEMSRDEFTRKEIGEHFNDFVRGKKV